MSTHSKYFNTPFIYYGFGVNYTINKIVDKESFDKSFAEFYLFYKNLSSHPLSTLRNGEYFTPLERVNSILDRLEKVIPNLFKNKDHTFFDPCCGLGQFQILIYFKLLKNLVNEFNGDYQKCSKHILENMIYINDINEGNIQFIKTLIFPDIVHYKTSDALISIPFNKKSFTCVLFNPPYSVYHSNSSTTLYPDFCQLYLPLGKISCCIIPNIWICSSRQKYFISWMKSQPLYSITDYTNPSRYFKINIQLHGYIEEIITINNSKIIDIDTINKLKQGYYYELINNDDNVYKSLRNDFVKYNHDIDIFLHTNKYDDFLKKVFRYIEKNGNILDIFYGTTYYDITTNDRRLHKNKENDDILCYIASRRGQTAYINKNNLFKKVYKRVFKHKMKATNTEDIFVITAYTTPRDKDAFVKLIICNEKEVYNASYIGFKVKSYEEANNLISYLSTDFVKTLLILRKQSISISKFQLLWIPFVPLDRMWNNEDILKYMGIDEIPEEIL